MADSVPEGSPRRIGRRAWILLVAVLLLASALRFYHLGRLSLWYDEVVSMRLARTPDPPSLVRLLDQVDATRAPLHPLLLQGWLTVFGPSDLAGRALSALCGVATCALVFWVGRLAHDTATGLWGAWLAAWSPLLVAYSREARMYAWLVLATCLAWGLLFSSRRSSSLGTRIGYALLSAALIYSHPLGLLMAGSLALASFWNRGALGLSGGPWLSTHAAAMLAVAPWVRRYFDHAPESTVGRLPWRFLPGMPIGFIGGNRLSLLVTVGILLFGLFGARRGKAGDHRVVVEEPVAASCLLIWFAVPPLLLYAYSRVAYPIFGPPRYTLFVGPAYLLLVARGLAKLPLPHRLALAGAGAALSASLLETLVYAPDLKADWRAAAAYLDRHAPGAPVVVIATDPAHHVEVETARYYLGTGRQVIPMPDRWEARPTSAWFSVGMRAGHPVGNIPEPLRRDDAAVVNLPGLRLIRPR